ncbi:transmembrane protein 267 isoform X3 [Wyeomyia smithii]|uniref:transmembrane protein 267 isoform X3 n=1 Tax=Wyeomyia smithii TaxID=174621 RepID=UPI002467EDF8|nr:transmembrane protein 267 isoform X3 [Wyeomyia smithii]XP_055536912.1 transmembrane protein 267 isoform X3 [Wyeomyia smithii]
MSPMLLLLLKHALMLLICIAGDKLQLVVQKPHLLRAVIDNASHALIGLIASEIVVHHYKDHLGRSQMYGLIATGCVLSSVIDLDHFIEAKSFHLEDATSLSRRPFLHNSSIFMALLGSIVVAVSLPQHLLASLWLSVTFVAFFTHQLRDAIRRGFWFRAPYLDYSTAPVIYWVYLVLTQLCPHALIQLLSMQVRKGRMVPVTGDHDVKYKPLDVV